MPKQKLLPCPFCGHMPFKEVWRFKDSFFGMQYKVVCSNFNCVISGPIEETKKSAIEAWNRRTNA